MKFLSQVIFWITTISLLYSCNAQEYNEFNVVNSGFIDLDSILKAQGHALAGKSITKFAKQDQNSEQKEFTFDHAQWEIELKVFKEINLNKPGLVGSYNRTVNAQGDIELFDRKASEKRGPEHVEIKRTSNGTLVELSAHICKNNILYQTKKEYRLNFEPTTGLLKSYEFAGVQKLILKDEVKFRIFGEIK